VLYPDDIMSLASNMEDVAQLAERRPVEANVAGSFPVILPKESFFHNQTTFFFLKVVLILKLHSVFNKVRNTSGTGDKL
jgi:hypothetical protein